jgi:hypothetical protein
MATRRRLPLDRRGAAKGRGDSSSRAEDRNQALDSCPGTHTRANETTKEVDGIDDVDVPVLEVSTSPSLEPAVVSHSDAGNGVEALAWERSIDLTSVANVQKGGEGIGKVQDEQCSNTVEVGHGGSDEEGQDPVDRAQSVPQKLALLGCDLGEVQDLLEYFNVDSFHSDVEIEH